MEIVRDGNFKEFTKEGLVVIDLWASWCRPCTLLLPIMEKIEKQYDTIKLGKLNVDENSVAKSLNVTAIPTLLFYKNGELVDTLVGLNQEEKIKEKIHKHL